MKHISLGGLDVSRIGLGTMAMSGYYLDPGSSDAESIRTIQRAVELGVTHIDTAEIYGPYANEELVGRALNGRRDDVVLATKFGLVSHAGEGPGSLDSSPANIRTAVEGSLKRLGTDRIDLYYQHRVDPNTPIEDTVGTLAELITEGKILHIGLSEAGPETIRRAHAVHPIAALQTEYSLWTRDPEAELLPLLRELGIGFVPYSPLGHGFLTGQIRSPQDLADDDWRKTNPRFTKGNFEQNLGIVDEVRTVATELDASAAQVALAWLLAQGDDIAPIPGTKRVSRVEENTAADGVTLSAGQIQRLNNLTPAAGERHDEANMSAIDDDHRTRLSGRHAAPAEIRSRSSTNQRRRSSCNLALCTRRSSFGEIRSLCAGSGSRWRSLASTTCLPTTTCSVPFTLIEHLSSQAPIPSTTRSTTRS